MVNETTKSDRTDEILAATIGNVSLFAPLSKLEQMQLRQAVAELVRDSPRLYGIRR